MTSQLSFGRSGRSRRSTIGLFALLVPCLLAVGGGGCGGGDGGTDLGPGGPFLGRWQIDASSTFMINCPMVMLSGNAPVWTELVFEKGVLTDVTEASATCIPPGLSFDVASGGLAMGVVNPDPYTGAAPLCSLTLGSDAMGFPVYLDLTFTALEFTLLQAVAGQAPTALLSGTATGVIAQENGTGTGTYVAVDTCTYSGSGDTFYRMSQP